MFLRLLQPACHTYNSHDKILKPEHTLLSALTQLRKFICLGIVWSIKQKNVHPLGFVSKKSENAIWKFTNLFLLPVTELSGSSS